MLWREHRPFLVLLGIGAVLRLVVQLSFPPGFVFSDGPVYLGIVDHPVPLQERVVGYGLFLHALAWVSREVWLVTVVQHLLGLGTATLVYTLLRRWSVGSLTAALATVPVLFDAMQLALEHSVLSDVLFDVLVVAGVGVLAWPDRPRLVTSSAAGLLLGAAVCVRVVGQPLVVAAVLFCLLAAATWRQRLINALVVTVAFVVPVLGYATWYHSAHGLWAVSESDGRALYMRTTAWVDCSRLTIPDYERPLCPPEPVGQRREPTEYGWHSPDSTHGLIPPPGVTPDEAMHDFAVTAITAQPWDYTRTVARDVALNFMVPRVDYFEYDTAGKWTFERYLDHPPTDYTRPAYEAHGGDLPSVREPGARVVAGYGSVVYLWGPALLALLLLAVWSLGRVDARTRAVVALLLLVGLGLTVAPAVTAEFVWRYQLPGVVMVPMAAAVGWAGLRRRAQDGTAATPSTDWPKGGRTRRSTKRVAGTTHRS